MRTLPETGSSSPTPARRDVRRPLPPKPPRPPTPPSRTGPLVLADHRSPAHDAHPRAELLDLFELVRHEDDDHALVRERAEDLEQRGPLRGRDARRRLVQDEHPGAQPAQSRDLDPLP